MRDPFRWSISLGRWGVPTVRLHVFFIVFAAATYFLCLGGSGSNTAGLAGTATLAIVVLLASVLAHEWSHWLVAHRFAIAPDTLVIGPLGGVSEWPDTSVSKGALASMLAGPAANVMIALVCAVILQVIAPPAEWLPLLNPLIPAWAETTTSLAQQGLQLTIWINWLLFLANLLPAFPFDGGRILRASLHIARPNWQESRVVEIVFWTAVFLSALIMVAALFLLKFEDYTVLPTSFALLLLSVVLLVSARRDVDNSKDELVSAGLDTELEERWLESSEADELEEDDFAVEDLDDEYAEERTLEDEPWLQTPMIERRAPAPEEVEAEEERRVDAILSRLHSQGLESLSSEERELLERVSARYRSRLGRRT